jgi:ferric enterobactin receptor
MRDSRSSADLYALFLEDNIAIGERLTLTPGLRFDHHSEFGWNVSPALNASLDLGSGFTLKGGIARAFKAPNLYQSNPNYLYYTMGNGCPFAYPSLGAGCYVMGNDELDPETSWNSEIGILYSQNGWNASLTYFHNKYDNKIVAGDVPVGSTAGGTGRIFQWQNSGPATVEGFEGNLLVPVLSTLSWNTNFTYMIRNENDQTGQPLSVVPEYTINTSLDWQATERLGFMFALTYYGKQEPRTINARGGTVTGNGLDARDPYALVNVSGTFDVNAHTRLTAGVMNVFNEQLKREGGSADAAGANTYNEPGRAYFVSLTASF